MRVKKKISGYLTVYLALILGVLCSLSLALIEGVRSSTLQLESACIADIAMDSVMAEYHRELFRRFNILAIDSSYGTGTVGSPNLCARLEYYLEKNMIGKAQEEYETIGSFLYKDFCGLKLNRVQLTGLLILSDQEGAVFRQKAVEAVKSDVGAEALTEVRNWLTTVEEKQLDSRDVEAEKRAVDDRIESYQGRQVQISEDEWKTIAFQNPTQLLENRKKTGILSQVLREGELSGKQINGASLIRSRRKEGRINSGNMEVLEGNLGAKALEKLLFQEYLVRYFGCYTEPLSGSALDYEVEYLIAGKEADADNLRSVVHRLLAIREAANASYLFSDEVKCGEADLVALGLSLLIDMPELQDLFRTAILLGWAYLESIYDIQTLVRGGRVVLMKDSDSWHYGLQSVFQDIWNWDESDAEKGLCYKDYLRILLMLANQEELSYRAMDMVEADIRLTRGNEAFRLDGCYVRIAAKMEIGSRYGYLQIIEEEKEY